MISKQFILEWFAPNVACLLTSIRFKANGQACVVHWIMFNAFTFLICVRGNKDSVKFVLLHQDIHFLDSSFETRHILSVTPDEVLPAEVHHKVWPTYSRTHLSLGWKTRKTSLEPANCRPLETVFACKNGFYTGLRITSGCVHLPSFESSLHYTQFGLFDQLNLGTLL